jgi:glycolate oxidase FAD binding subunit
VSAHAQAALAEIVPPGRFAAATERSRYAVDGLVPETVVFAESIAEMEEAVRAAGAAGLSMLPAGLGAHLTIGMPPDRLDCVLSTARLGGVVEHAAADMTVTVRAGATAADIATALSSAGQWLPLDPPVPLRTTVGGLLAANLTGLLRPSQGAVRDLAIGLRAVRADGRVIGSGGRVVKNVAGYDLHKAFIGSHGTLGIVVEATFKVRPRPEAEMTLVVVCPSFDAASRLVTAVRDAGVEPLWMAIAGAGVLLASEEHHPDAAGSAATLVIGLGGSAKSLDVQRDRITVLVRTHAGPGRLGSVVEPAATAVPLTAAAEPYATLRDFAATTAGDALCTVSLLPSDVGEYIEAAMTACARQRVRVKLVIEPTVARLHAVLQSEGTYPADDGLGAAVVQMRELATSRRGHLVLRRASRGVKARAGVWGDLGPAGFLMQRLRQTFDPRGTLARGRFVEAG